jgi:SulP family sulfate permease
LAAGPWVAKIPGAAIAGVLLGTSYRILNPQALKRSLQTTRSEAAVLLLTAAATLAIDLIWGITIGVALYAVLAWRKK